MEHRSTIPEDRPLSAQELALVRWLLDHGAPSARTYLGEIETLRVVSRCGCGCASVDFVNAPPAGLDVLSDYKWQDEQGRLFGAFAFAKAGKLAGIEVWSIDGRATPSSLPDPSDLAPIK